MVIARWQTVCWRAHPFRGSGAAADCRSAARIFNAREHRSPASASRSCEWFLPLLPPREERDGERRAVNSPRLPLSPTLSPSDSPRCPPCLRTVAAGRWRSGRGEGEAACGLLPNPQLRDAPLTRRRLRFSLSDRGSTLYNWASRNAGMRFPARARDKHFESKGIA